jgi:hypothetical protein
MESGTHLESENEYRDVGLRSKGAARQIPGKAAIPILVMKFA